MMRDPGVGVYVPATYVLMDSKQQDAYWNALNYVIVQTGRPLEPATVTCDFEHGLMNAITEQFPLVKIVGCLFHWKQALRRKMVELRIARPQISAVLRPGVIDVLTIIPVDQIADKGIHFVRAQMDETGNKTKWDAFWRYFRKTWMKSYGAGLWNVNSMTESGIDLQNRTNNPLEGYNRAFGDRFTVKHPSLLSFVETAKADARRFMQLIDDVKHNRRYSPPHAPNVEPRIPVEFHDFE
ncbi:hypothetical protein PC121_g4092 [Phytophthora cactorum]|nr:hypothetical protein PC120_g2606 [Phytophthora cactorum]KAG3090302.1 hypothetical protein PC121_g4092 [Phytophthora cactorum]KAG4062079.1 hypothetical protein PC123_g3039 [Phytophthora cactorum]